MEKVLVIDDDPGISRSLSLYLTESGFEVLTCQDGGEAVQMFQEEEPDIVILDINLPNVDGIELCRRFRDISSTPILMLSARDAQSDIVACLEIGADDYVSKPFSAKEVVSRLRAILRRWGVKKSNTGNMTYKDLHLDENNLSVTRDGHTEQLTKSEFYILKKLVENEGAVVSRDDLMHEIMGYSNYIYDRTIDTHVKNVRKKMGEDIILTVRGIWYKIY